MPPECSKCGEHYYGDVKCRCATMTNETNQERYCCPICHENGAREFIVEDDGISFKGIGCYNERCWYTVKFEIHSDANPKEVWQAARSHRPKVSFSELAAIVEGVRYITSAYEDMTLRVIDKLKKDGVVFDVTE